MITERAGTLATVDAVSLEARIGTPPTAPGGVVLCHPHPLYGGDMDNPVVVRAQEVCSAVGLATLRFNFRGVGRSTGSHGNGIAERADVEAAVAHLAGILPGDTGVALVGYSFGASVVAEVAAKGIPLKGVCLIAPPLAFEGYALPASLGALPDPIWIVAGTRDQYCPASTLRAIPGQVPRAEVRTVDGADHFFFGKLFPLGELVGAWAGSAFRL